MWTERPPHGLYMSGCSFISSPQVEVVLCVVQPQTDGHRVPLSTLCEDVIHDYLQTGR